MNIIDQNYQTLHHLLEQKTKEELFHTMKDGYIKLNKEIKKSIEDYFQKFSYWGRLSEEKMEWEHIELKANILKEHLADFDWLYKNLGDYRSKKLLFAILNNYYQYDFQSLNQTLEKNFSHYFDLDLIPFAKEEVFVDLGAYTGDTILDFLSIYGTNSYKKIYAYEITDHTFEVLKQNLSSYQNIFYRKKAVLEKRKDVCVKENQTDASANEIGEEGSHIEATTLDQDIKDTISIIKMDIEGSEQKALLGCKKHIKKDHPTLLLSVYHNLEDLYQIPKMIKEIRQDYQFYLRNYGGPIYPTEIVLIAIPKKERA